MCIRDRCIGAVFIPAVSAFAAALIAGILPSRSPFSVGRLSLIHILQGQFDAVLGHTSLREVIGTDLLGTVTGTDLAPACLCLRIVGFLTLDIV